MTDYLIGLVIALLIPGSLTLTWLWYVLRTDTVTQMYWSYWKTFTPVWVLIVLHFVAWPAVVADLIWIRWLYRFGGKS